jgi:hypothetical protein
MKQEDAYHQKLKKRRVVQRENEVVDARKPALALNQT